MKNRLRTPWFTPKFRATRWKQDVQLDGSRTCLSMETEVQLDGSRWIWCVYLNSMMQKDNLQECFSVKSPQLENGKPTKQE